MPRFSSLALCCLLSLASAMFTDAARAQDNPRVKIDTSKGSFILELYEKEAPITVANFLRYVDEGFYNNTIFHRVIRRFVVQGGGYTPEMIKKDTHKPIVNESKNRLHNDRFTVAMARHEDPDSASSQFYINLRMNSQLNYRMDRPGYTVFGAVVAGRDVLNDMGFVATHTFAGMEDVPIEPVVLISAVRVAQ
jgi:cyclophilin family peptidyl-prolyl cis-trans isomerase